MIQIKGNLSKVVTDCRQNLSQVKVAHTLCLLVQHIFVTLADFFPLDRLIWLRFAYLFRGLSDSAYIRQNHWVLLKHIALYG